MILDRVIIIESINSPQIRKERKVFWLFSIKDFFAYLQWKRQQQTDAFQPWKHAGSSQRDPRLQLTRDLEALEHLDLVANLDTVVLHADAALGA